MSHNTAQKNTKFNARPRFRTPYRGLNAALYVLSLLCCFVVRCWVVVALLHCCAVALPHDLHNFEFNVRQSDFSCFQGG